MTVTRSREGEAREAMLVAATRLFAERGFEATSFQDVATAVGVSKQAVLHYFASKARLREAVLEAQVAHWHEALPRLLTAATASEDRFEAVLGELVRFFTSDPHRARVVLREALDRPAETKALLKGPVKPWLAAVAGYITRGQRRGEHHATLDPDAYVALMLELVIVACASAPLLDAAVGEGGRARVTGELLRIARTALFLPKREGAAAPEAETRSARKKKLR